MLVQSEQFTRDRQPPEGLREAVMKYCELSFIDFEGAGFEGAYLDCAFLGCSWYWALCLQAVFVGTRFQQCRFDGVSFSDCKFVEYVFENCSFGIDSLGKPCSFEDVRWYGTKFIDCIGAPNAL